MNETRRLRLARRMERATRPTRWLRRKTGRCEWTGLRECPWHPGGGNHPGAAQ